MSDTLHLSVSQANLKKFMEYVQQRNIEKVSKFLEKGLDPNFHDPESGGEETVATLASRNHGIKETGRVNLDQTKQCYKM